MFVKQVFLLFSLFLVCTASTGKISRDNFDYQGYLASGLAGEVDIDPNSELTDQDKDQLYKSFFDGYARDLEATGEFKGANKRSDIAWRLVEDFHDGRELMGLPEPDLGYEANAENFMAYAKQLNDSNGGRFSDVKTNALIDKYTDELIDNFNYPQYRPTEKGLGKVLKASIKADIDKTLGTAPHRFDLSAPLSENIEILESRIEWAERDKNSDHERSHPVDESVSSTNKKTFLSQVGIEHIFAILISAFLLLVIKNYYSAESHEREKHLVMDKKPIFWLIPIISLNIAVFSPIDAWLKYPLVCFSILFFVFTDLYRTRRKIKIGADLVVNFLVWGPLLGMVFWGLFDPILGMTSRNIKYGYIRNLPQEYIGNWVGEYDDDVFQEQRMLVKLDSILYYEKDADGQTTQLLCKPNSVVVTYTLVPIQNRFDSEIIELARIYYQLLLPRTLFGSQKLTIGCRGKEPEKVSLVQGDWSGLFLKFVKDGEPYSYHMDRR